MGVEWSVSKIRTVHGGGDGGHSNSGQGGMGGGDVEEVVRGICYP